MNPLILVCLTIAAAVIVVAAVVMTAWLSRVFKNPTEPERHRRAR